MIDQNAQKRAAAFAAADLVPDGATIGLGTGSTFAFVIARLGERLRQGLSVRGVPTSRTTAELAQQAGIPLVDLDAVDRLDLAIDGADEVDPHKNLIKGGGGAHLRERLVASAAAEMVVVVDESKLVKVLGAVFPLPVEVSPLGWTHTARRIAATGCEPRRREQHGKPWQTDNGNYVLDCRYPGIPDPAALQRLLDGIVGVVDHGLFVGMAGRVVVADAAGRVRVLP
ncbi:MAG: ribose-5-phosphate isomerase RpiA [Planctomycetes bacterium]|nr:ribose-5-phosphate isomerase RpiA [Planctomycetota bacterium]